MDESVAFDVFVIGIDPLVNIFVEKVKPNIVGMGRVLTLALKDMKDTVGGLKKQDHMMKCKSSKVKLSN